MGLPAGELDRRIRIERAVTATSNLGTELETWSELTTVWAKVTPVSDGERIRARGVGAEVSVRFVIRYSSMVAGVGPLDCVVYEGRTYNVTGVKEAPQYGRRVALEITASARAD